MKGKPLTPSQIKAARELKTKGLTYREIAHRLGISKSAVGEITVGTPLKEKPPKTYGRSSTQKAPRRRDTGARATRLPARIVVSPHRETAAELKERFRLRRYYSEQAIKYHRAFYTLLDEHKLAEAVKALIKARKARQEFERLLGPR